MQDRSDNHERADLGELPLPVDTVGLLEGIVTTRAIRRYRDEPVGEADLRAILFAATRAPSGSNRQPFRFLVMASSRRALEAKTLIGDAARRAWAHKRRQDGYDDSSPAGHLSPKARLDAAMQYHVDHFEQVPVVVLPMLVGRPTGGFPDGASIYPACENLLLAARALGYGGVITRWHVGVERELRQLLAIPKDVTIAATITLGRPLGRHGPVRRQPLGGFVFEDTWGISAPWAVDPPDTRHTTAGPPRRAV